MTFWNFWSFGSKQCCVWVYWSIDLSNLPNFYIISSVSSASHFVKSIKQVLYLTHYKFYTTASLTFIFTFSNLMLIIISTMLNYFNQKISGSYIVLATKWLRILSIPPNDKIRNHLVSNPIVSLNDFCTWIISTVFISSNILFVFGNALYIISITIVQGIDRTQTRMIKSN